MDHMHPQQQLHNIKLQIQPKIQVQVVVQDHHTQDTPQELLVLTVS
jgi:hypothetical protein